MESDDSFNGVRIDITISLSFGSQCYNHQQAKQQWSIPSQAEV